MIRPTFYNHFADKYALLEYIVWHDLLEPIKPLLLNDMIQEGLTLLFSSMQNERAFYERAVCIDGQNSFESIARSEVSKLLLEIIDQKKQGKSHKYAWLDRQIIAEYYANSMCYVAIAWIKRDYMISPKDFLTEFRISRGKEQLVLTDLSVEEIAVSCGYRNSLAFGKVFKQKMGMTPTQYRNNNRKAARERLINAQNELKEYKKHKTIYV